MLKEVTLTQGTKEWLDWRLNGITATEAACAISASEWGTALSVYEAKLSKDTQQPQSEYIEWGSMLEDVIKFKKFAKEHPEYEVRQGGCYEDEWRKCSLDGELLKDGEKVAILEIKTGSNESKWDPVPPGYYAQAQWQMHVTGYRKVIFAVLINGHRYFERTVEYDAEYCERLENKCRNLWNCIITKTRPEPDELHPEIDQPILNEAAAKSESEETYEISRKEYEAYTNLKKRADEIDIALKAMKLRFTDMLNKYKYITYDGRKFGQMVSVKGREGVDMKRLKAEYPEVYEAVKTCGKPASYPKFG